MKKKQIYVYNIKNKKTKRIIEYIFSQICYFQMLYIIAHPKNFLITSTHININIS